MRIVSLLSSATEIVYELALEEHLVGISHECDYPPDALSRPRLSRSRFDPAAMTSVEIDAAVRASMEAYGSVYEVDAEALWRLAPDIVLTQAVCEVCAVPTGSVEAAVAWLEAAPRVVSLDAHTLEGIVATIHQVAAAAGVPERGERTVGHLRSRLAGVRDRVGGQPRPRVLALEWLAPPFVPGHWIPEMIREAGGENLVGMAGAVSTQEDWEVLQGLDPDVLLLLPCGYDLEQAREDAEANRGRLEQVAPRAVFEGRAWIGHGAFFSRSGPRVVSGIEALAAALHPHPEAEQDLAGRLEVW